MIRWLLNTLFHAIVPRLPGRLLHAAYHARNLKMFKWLIVNGRDPNETDATGTPLIFTLLRGEQCVCHVYSLHMFMLYTIASGADLSKWHDGNAVFDLALQRQCYLTIDVLMWWKKNNGQNVSMSPMAYHWAVSREMRDAAVYLIERGCGPATESALTQVPTVDGLVESAQADVFVEKHGLRNVYRTKSPGRRTKAVRSSR